MFGNDITIDNSVKLKTRAFAKLVLFGSFKAAGAYRYLRKKHKGRPIVLTYHGVIDRIPKTLSTFEFRNFVTTGQFENQIKFLLKNYRPLKVADFYNSFENLNNGFLITFDDGFQNNYRYAVPILKKYGLQGCFFITTELIGTRKFLWTEKITRAILNTQKKKLVLELDETTTYDLDAVVKKEYASQSIRKYLKSLHPSSVRKIIENMCLQLSDVDIFMKPEEEARYLFMTWDDIRGIVEAGQVVGSHTHTHPVLSTISEKESYRELEISKGVIEENTEKPCLAMSYPNGEREDFSNVQLRQLEALGYRCAFTQISTFDSPNMHPFTIPRINISSGMSSPIFEATICGFRKN